MGIKWPEPENELSPSSCAKGSCFQLYFCGTNVTSYGCFLLNYFGGIRSKLSYWKGLLW